MSVANNLAIKCRIQSAEYGTTLLRKKLRKQGKIIECRMQNDLIPLSLHSQGNELNAECGTRNNATRMQNSECRIQNYFTPLHYAHKEKV